MNSVRRGETASTETGVYIGPAGWAYPDWDGIVYPGRKPRGWDPLPFLASYFNVIEINSTFYRVPDRATCRRWSERVCGIEDFRFTVKAFRGFTHERRHLDFDAVAAFQRAIAPLFESQRLGAVLVQFPWSFRCDTESMRYTAALAESLAPMPVAVEVRHGSWAADDVRRFFAERRLTLCAVDQPAVGESLGPDTFAAGAAGVYYRLHGRNRAEWFKPGTTRNARYNYLYSNAEMEAAAQRIRRLAARHKPVNIVLNNHFRGQAVANALGIRAALSGERVAAPPGLVAAYPQLEPALRPETPPAAQPREIQGKLFDQDRQEE